MRSAGDRVPAVCAFEESLQEACILLKYIWMVTQDLFLTVTFATLIRAVLGRLYGGTGRRFDTIGIAVGVAASAVLAVVKNTTNLIISSHWNHYIYGSIMVLSLAFLVLTLVFGRKENRGALGVSGALLCATGAGLTAVWIFFKLPGVMAYPFNFNTMGNGYLSWYYFERLIGWLIALLMLVIYARLLYACALQIKKYALPLSVLNIGLTANMAYCAGRFFVPWVNRAKWLNWPVRYTREEFGWIGDWMMFTAQQAQLFIWITAALVLALAVVFFAENTKVTERYDNPAQLRKLRARNRRHRRQAVAGAVFLVLAAVCIGPVQAYDTRVIELSAPETYTVEGDQILIPMEEVNDGHLHRFEYRTEKNIDVRWIVVKKPGSASFGVGLDACEVCGNAGYFERGGQVICKRCDVVMNINTIGFKGGCNPIPLAYTVRSGYLVFDLNDIRAGEKEFR